MPLSKLPVRCGPAGRSPSAFRCPASVTGRRKARRASVVTICCAQAVSAAALAGLQTKILRRLGLSVAGFAFERARDRHLADVREELVSGQAAGFDGAAQEVLVQIVPGDLGGREERDDHGVAPGLERNLMGVVPLRTRCRERRPYPNRTA